MYKNYQRPGPPIFLPPSPTPRFSKQNTTATTVEPVGIFVIRGAVGVGLIVLKRG